MFLHGRYEADRNVGALPSKTHRSQAELREKGGTTKGAFVLARTLQPLNGGSPRSLVHMMLGVRRMLPWMQLLSSQHPLAADLMMLFCTSSRFPLLLK